MLRDPWLLRKLLLHDLLTDLFELQRKRRSTYCVCMRTLMEDDDVRNRVEVTGWNAYIEFRFERKPELPEELGVVLETLNLFRTESHWAEVSARPRYRGGLISIQNSQSSGSADVGSRPIIFDTVSLEKGSASHVFPRA